MITERELNSAIEEMLSRKDPDAAVCRNLASYYTIRDHLYGGQPEQGPDPAPEYSAAAPPAEIIEYQGRSEFAKTVNGLPVADVLYVMEQLFEMLRATNRRTYEAAMDELREI